VSPQPRPRSKRSVPPPDDDEVLTPDLVTDPDGEVDGEADEPAPYVKPDRRPLWALIAGITTIWFALTGAYLLVIPIGLFAIIYGRLTANRVKREDGPPRQRKQATWGFALGIVGTLFLAAQIAYFAAFFKWDKTDDDFDLTTEKPAVTTPTTEPTGEPAG
jgi:hypothetical protein